MLRRVALLTALLLAPTALWAQEKPKAPTLPTGSLDTKDWLKSPTSPLAKGEIDRLVGEQLAKAGIKPAPLVADEAFARRAWLDLTGRLPMPADVKEFLADNRPDKRARLIDRLLDSDDFATHQAQYWRNVISSRTTDFKANFGVKNFETWLADQFKTNKGWDHVVRALLTATGTIRPDEPDKNGQAFFLASRFGQDAPVELAAETSRIFLGIQIQCAQCHDHPSDVWKREQFHELTAYFTRVKQRPIREQGSPRILGTELVSAFFGEHQMPGKDDPKKGAVMTPRFLDGKSPGPRLADQPRRKSLAESVVSKDNPWFAAALVNRVWGELLGQAFYQPVDDLGPFKEAVMPEVIARVSASFRGTGYDVKQLYRDVMNSETYQRQIRPGDSPDAHLYFAGHNPVRMDANTLWNTLAGTLGQIGPPAPKFAMAAAGPFARLASFENQFKQEFAFDPSAKAEEIEASISQALLLMNNPQVNQKIQARGTNLLARILASYSSDDEALKMVYLRTLARRPTEREVARCREHLSAAGSRAEGYEDILWALINSTEYQTRR